MYRIELAPGEETVFRTFEELATGVRNGFITSRARIYHAASQKWLPIEFHPHYKQALENPARHAPVAFAPISASPFSPKENATVAVFPVAVESVTVEPPVMAASSMDSRLPEAPTAIDVVPADEPMSPEPATSSALELPKISYAEITPVEQPVARRPRTSGGHRFGLQLAGVAVVLLAGAYAARSVFSSSREDAAPVPVASVVDRPALTLVKGSPAAPRSAGAAARVPAKQPTPVTSPARARLNLSEPASSGFAPALEPRALVAMPPTKAAVDRPESSSSDSSSLAPAPSALDLVVPALPPADSLIGAPRQHTDSALKRILRAVSGGKDVPQQR